MWTFPFYTDNAATLDWEGLKRAYPWVRDMEGVEQDPIFHAEGDVAIHTRMVISELLSLDAFKALDPTQKHIMFASALLHDVEKRSTTAREFEKGREVVTSKGHAKKGEHTTRAILYKEIPTPFALRESVCKLVRQHSLPIRLFDKDSPQKEVLKHSLDGNNHLLAMIARADMQGRTSLADDMDELLCNIDLFIEQCKEEQCYSGPGPFASDLTRFNYFRKDGGVWPQQETFDDTICNAYIMCGIPASGKDHYIRQHLSHLPVVSMDDLRRQHGLTRNVDSDRGKIIQMAKEKAKEHLRKKQDFVWNATNVTRSTRESVINEIAAYRAKIHIVYVEKSYKRLLADNLDREHPVKESAIEHFITKLDIPSLTEAHTVTYHINE